MLLKQIMIDARGCITKNGHNHPTQAAGVDVEPIIAEHLHASLLSTCTLSQWGPRVVVERKQRYEGSARSFVRRGLAP